MPHNAVHLLGFEPAYMQVGALLTIAKVHSKEACF